MGRNKSQNPCRALTISLSTITEDGGVGARETLIKFWIALRYANGDICVIKIYPDDNVLILEYKKKTRTVSWESSHLLFRFTMGHLFPLSQSHFGRITNCIIFLSSQRHCLHLTMIMRRRRVPRLLPILALQTPNRIPWPTECFHYQSVSPIPLSTSCVKGHLVG